jgi:hypothetical protein
LVELIFLAKNNNKDNSKNLLAIFTLPYLYDFIVGIFCFYLLTKIAENNNFIKNGNTELINQSEYNNNNYNNIENDDIIRLNYNEQEIKNEIVRRQEQSE